jgi:hypothetical protein
MDLGRFDPTAMVHPRGYIKEDPWPLEEASLETLNYFFQRGSGERGPLYGYPP